MNPEQTLVLPGLLPEGVHSAEGNPTHLGTSVGLFDEELQAISSAVQSRREQYAATRHLARSVFARLGLPPQPLLNRKDRSPIWPPGHHGTLTHTEGWCAVAVAREHVVAGLGIDAERAQPIEVDVAKRVLTADEWTQIEQGGRDPLAVAALWFSAKESVYKCVFPSVLRFIGFTEVAVSIDFPRQEFRARALAPELVRSHGGLLTALEGRFARHSGLWITAASLPETRSL